MRVEITGQNDINTTAWTPVALSGSNINTITGSSVSGTQISLPAGLYEVTARLSYQSAAARTNLNLRYVEGANTYEAYGAGYARNASGHNQTGDTFTELIELTSAGTVSLELQGEGAGANTSVTLDGLRSRIIIKQLNTP